MTGKLFEDTAEVGNIVEAYALGAFGHRYRVVFQHFHRSFDADAELISVGRTACVGFKHSDKSVLGEMAHFCVFGYIYRTVKLNVHSAEYFFELFVALYVVLGIVE